MKRWAIWSWTVALLPMLALLMLAGLGTVTADTPCVGSCPVPVFSTEDGILLLMILFFLILIVLGFIVRVLHIMAALEGYFLTAEIWNVTGNLALSVSVAAIATFILLLAFIRPGET